MYGKIVDRTTVLSRFKIPCGTRIRIQRMLTGKEYGMDFAELSAAQQRTRLVRLRQIQTALLISF